MLVITVTTSLSSFVADGGWEDEKIGDPGLDNYRDSNFSYEAVTDSFGYYDAKTIHLCRLIFNNCYLYNKISLWPHAHINDTNMLSDTCISIEGYKKDLQSSHINLSSLKSTSLYLFSFIPLGVMPTSKLTEN